jgi:hypothetical protein
MAWGYSAHLCLSSAGRNRAAGLVRAVGSSVHREVPQLRSEEKKSRFFSGRHLQVRKGDNVETCHIYVTSGARRLAGHLCDELDVRSGRLHLMCRAPRSSVLKILNQPARLESCWK